MQSLEAASERLDQAQAVYEQHCAQCHGLNGEGQPNWQRPGPDGTLPAPPHDSTGHTWHHADAQLMATIATGRGAMPAFAEILTVAEQEALVDYMKTFWGEHERNLQADVTRQWVEQYGSVP